MRHPREWNEWLKIAWLIFIGGAFGSVGTWLGNRDRDREIQTDRWLLLKRISEVENGTSKTPQMMPTWKQELADLEKTEKQRAQWRVK